MVVGVAVRHGVFVALAVPLAFVGSASAHEGGAGAAGEHPVAFAALLFASVAVPLLVWVAVARTRSSLDRLPDAVGRSAVAVLVVLLGLSLLLVAVAERPVGAVGVAAAVAGLSLGVSARLPWVRHRHADVTLGAVLSHRVVEGVLLATLYTAGLAVGLAGALALTAHATVETVAVGGAYLDRGPLRATAAVLALQVGVLLGALVGLTTTAGLSPSVRTVLLAAAGGALVAAGLAGVRRPRRRAA